MSAVPEARILTTPSHDTSNTAYNHLLHCEPRGGTSKMFVDILRWDPFPQHEHRNSSPCPNTHALDAFW